MPPVIFFKPLHFLKNVVSNKWQQDVGYIKCHHAEQERSSTH